MTILVCGGRQYTNKRLLFRVLDRIHAKIGIGLLVHGDSEGADRLGGEWARSRKVTERRFPADWKTHGKAAGPIRNQEMLAQSRPYAVVAFPGNRGTNNMIELARRRGVPVLKISR